MRPRDVIYGKKTCLICDSTRTTTTFLMKACRESYKIQSDSLNCNSEKVLYLFKCKVCVEALYVGKAKAKFCYYSITRKADTELSGKGIEKYPRNFFTIIIFWMVI